MPATPLTRTTRHLYRGTAVTLSALALAGLGTGAAFAAGQDPSTYGTSRPVRDTTATAAVGVLVREDVDGGHFCTASVVDSPDGNVIMTAAHCLDGETDDLVFVPGYHEGTAPHGIWKLTSVAVDDRWSAEQDEDHDVAFAVVAARDARQVQDVVGAHPLATDAAATSGPARVTGYPGTSETPLTCLNIPTAYGASQLRIACGDFTTGTSGSPWVDADGRVVGLIGGHEGGGDTAAVSYSPALTASTRKLYERAVATAGR
ncbi:trypsin-like serine peptidase [Streptomyces sp. NPDC059009]|uniref:trypsin-like serine peptidase n=1 Tax=Streptomyces sp. NPDC059009 TaxID=3346694 RepID=UPI003698F4F5